jgi:hypothetical protein
VTLRTALVLALMGFPAAPILPPVQAAPITRTSTSPAQVLAAAEELLGDLRSGDAAALHGRLAPSVREATTVARIRERLAARGRVRSTRVTHLHSGVDDSTVDALVVTTSGNHPIRMVLDGSGRLLAWEWQGDETAVETTSIAFVSDLAAGRFVQARSRLSLDLQQDWSPETLAARWKGLQERTGAFRAVRGAVLASDQGSQQLVLVTTQFQRLTDNLFVILDGQGRITGVDFPVEAG